MSKIQLSELNPAGSELFLDSENYLNELNDQELGDVVGGFTISFAASGAQGGVGLTGISLTVQTNNGNTVNANTVTNANTVG